MDDPHAAASVSAVAAERRIFCVRADDRAAATAWTPAVTRHGPVTVAVLGGGDPHRAMSVRDAVRELLTARTGLLADPGETVVVGVAAGAQGPVPAGLGSGEAPPPARSDGCRLSARDRATRS